jgi:GNAT superfamily N-acetyltransferase
LPEDPGPARAAIRIVPSDQLRPGEAAALRELFDEAWSDDAEGFTEQDWGHAVGGVHVIAEAGGRMVAHASVVERELRTADHRLRTGYVEAVATRPNHQRQGLGSLVIEGVGELIDRSYELGALATGLVGFYERPGVGGVAGSDVRPDGGRDRSNCPGGRERLRPVDPDVPAARPLGADQLRVAAGRRVVGPDVSAWLVPMDRGQWVR